MQRACHWPTTQGDLTPLEVTPLGTSKEHAMFKIPETTAQQLARQDRDACRAYRARKIGGYATNLRRYKDDADTSTMRPPLDTTAPVSKS